MVLLASFEDITELDADMGRWGHFTRDQTIAPGNRAQKRHYTTAGSRRVGMRARTQVAGSQDTHTGARERELLWHQYTGRCRVSRLSERVCVCIGEQLFAHTDARLGALLFPLGVGLHTRRRRRRVRTILQHCFLRRSITQRKFPTKLRKHFFFPAGARGRHDGCLAPPTESTTTWNPAEPEIPHKN